MTLGAASSAKPDRVHPLLLKSFVVLLAYSLSIVICHSLETGNVLSEWSVSTIFALFKGGSHCSPVKYWPVSLMSVCCNVLEILVADHLVLCLNSSRLLSCTRI